MRNHRITESLKKGNHRITESLNHRIIQLFCYSVIQLFSYSVIASTTFSALPDGAPEFLAPEFDLESVEATNTPGSAEWYLPVERLKLPVTWRITRNGHVVTNSHGRTRISLEPTSGLWPNDSWHGLTVRDWCCGYDVGNADYVRLPGESDPEPQYFNLASPEMFNLTWNTHVGSTNYHYSALACSNEEYSVSSLYSGTELYKPQASRFDSIARSALLGSYEAYYERLYYASQAQRNEWEVDDWGETDDLQQFNFNPTNDLVATTPRFHPAYPTNDFESGEAESLPLRPIPASRRLTDAENIANLIDNIRKLFPAKLEVYALDDGDLPDDILDARPFIFRPHWLSDVRDYPSGDKFGARLWWASTVPPPASTQIVWGLRQDTVFSSTMGLFPELSMASTARELYERAVPFACYATTLDMLEGSREFDSSGMNSISPCFELFDAVIVDCPDAADFRFWDILPFDFHGMTVPGFLTNAYPRAAASVPFREDAFNRYVDVGTDTDVVRRMVPGRLDLVNQLMSVMDRTIMIPSMHITSTNTLTEAENVGVYTGKVTTVEASWNGASWDITGIKDEYDLSGTPQTNTTNSEDVVDGIRLTVSATSTDKEGGKFSHDEDGYISIDDDWMYNHLPRPSTNVVGTIGEAGIGVVLSDEDGEYLGFVGIGGRDRYDPLSFQVTPSASITRSYRWSVAESAGRIGVELGPHQPGAGAETRVDSCKYALLDTQVSSMQGSDPKWRSEAGDYEAGGLPDKLSSHAESCLGQVKGNAPSGYNVPEDYIPLPSSVKLKCKDLQTTGRLDIMPTYPTGDEITNVIYHFTLPAPGGTVEMAQSDMMETNIIISVFEWEVHIDHVFDKDGVETTTVTTNQMGSWAGPGAYSELHEGEPWVKEIIPPDPPTVDMVYTNSYPTKVSQSGTVTTNLEVTTYYDAYENVENWYTIVESYTYEADPTKDWSDTRYELEEHNEWMPWPEDVTNLTTTVELTVTNSLPEDAVYQRTDVRIDQESAKLVLVATEGGNLIYDVFTNPLTGEERWVESGPPRSVASYRYDLGLHFGGEIDADLEPDHEAFDESLFFRVMTQVDWLWNYMKLEKEEQ